MGDIALALTVPVIIIGTALTIHFKEKRNKNRKI